MTALVRRDDDVLMVRQAGPGEEPVWTIPGGRVEPGEFVTEALVRETREETGVEVVDSGDRVGQSALDRIHGRLHGNQVLGDRPQ